MVSVVDLIVLAFVIISMTVGFMTGFLWQFVRVAGLVISILVSWLYHPLVAEWLGQWLGERASLAIGGMVVFAGVLLICYLIAFLFRDVINALKPEMPDRILGAAFGLLKAGLLVGAAAFLAVHYLSPENPVRAELRESRGAMAAATCVRAVLYVLPGELTESPGDLPQTERAVSAGSPLVAEQSGPGRAGATHLNRMLAVGPVAPHG